MEGIHSLVGPPRMTADRAIRALTALGHDTRLKVHRMLVRAGEDGLSAGVIARKLGLPASSLSFHLMHLQAANLVRQRRVGRSLIYAVNLDCVEKLMAYLQENCCRGFAEEDGSASAGAEDLEQVS